MRAHSSRVPAGPAYASHPPPPPADVLTYVEVLQRHCQDNGFELPVMPPREYAAYDEQVVGGAGGGGEDEKQTNCIHRRSFTSLFLPFTRGVPQRVSTSHTRSLTAFF